MEYNFENLPRYQRLQQKIATYSPDQAAIIDSLIADKQFANEQMRTELAGMRLARQKEAGAQSKRVAEHGLRMGDIREKSLEQRADVQDFERKQSRLGEYAGWANVLASTGLGLAKYKVLSDLAKKQKGLRKDMDAIWPLLAK